MDEIDVLTPKYPPDKTYVLTYLEIALARFWGEGMGIQPGAPDGDYIILYHIILDNLILNYIIIFFSIIYNTS